MEVPSQGYEYTRRLHRYAGYGFANEENAMTAVIAAAAAVTVMKLFHDFFMSLPPQNRKTARNVSE